MTRRTTLRRALVVALTLTACLSVVAPASAGTAKTTHRSIQEVVRAQGTYCFPDGSGGCVLFDPPVPNYIFFEALATQWVGAVDYAGLEDSWLKGASNGEQSFRTKFSGTVLERPLPDGRAEITIKLITQRAATRVFLAPDTLLFGNTTPAVLAGARPALGESRLDFVFINPAVGMALPDFVQLFVAPLPGQEFIRSEIRATAEGPLHSAFGVRDGTRGRMTMDMIATAANPSAREVLELSVIKDE
jgi:hypothetical protein